LKSGQDVVRKNHTIPVMYGDPILELDIGRDAGLRVLEPGLDVPRATFRITCILEDGDDAVTGRFSRPGRREPGLPAGRRREDAP
jgi:hypothetical protein